MNLKYLKKFRCIPFLMVESKSTLIFFIFLKHIFLFLLGTSVGNFCSAGLKHFIKFVVHVPVLSMSTSRLKQMPSLTYISLATIHSYIGTSYVFVSSSCQRCHHCHHYHCHRCHRHHQHLGGFQSRTSAPLVSNSAPTHSTHR